MMSLLLLFCPVSKAHVRPERMLSGAEAVDGQFPFIAYLFLTTRSGLNFTCTGVILKDDMLLASGECGRSAGSGFAVTGSVNVSNVDVDDPRPPYFVYAVQRIVVHPLLYLGEMRCEHSVSIIILKEKMKAEDRHGIATLSFGPFVDGSRCTVAGYGKGPDGVMTNRLIYDTARFDMHFVTFVCSDRHIGCAADSGSPVICGGKVYAIFSFYTSEKVSNYYCEEGGIDFYSLLSADKEFIRDALNGIFPEDSGSPVPGGFASYVIIYLICFIVFISFFHRHR